MNLTQAQVNTVAAKASWYFDVQFPQTGRDGDWAVFTGDGTDDLDRFLDLIDSLPAYPPTRIVLDIGDFASSRVNIDRTDVVAIREAYVLKYGDVDKPPYIIPDGGGIQV